MVETLRWQRHRASTRKNYHKIWNGFNKFLLNLDVVPDKWEDRIILFIGQLIAERKQSATIKSYISAIRAILRQDRVKLREDEFLINSLTRACRLRNDTVKLRDPIQKTMLNELIGEVRNYYGKILNQPYLSVLYQSILSTAYFGMFRIGEVTSGDHPILAGDVQIGTNKQKIQFFLRSSKTHGKESRPQSVKISSQPIKSKRRKQGEKMQFCPYELIRRYPKIRGPFSCKKKSPFFVFSDGSKVTPAHMRQCLGKILKRKGYDPKRFTFHCLRSGRAHDLRKYGLSVETIKKLGRWKSNAVYAYLK